MSRRSRARRVRGRRTRGRPTAAPADRGGRGGEHRTCGLALPFAAGLALCLSHPAAAQEAADTLAVPPDSATADPARADSAMTSFGACPDRLSGPAGAGGVDWGDTLAATSHLEEVLGSSPLSDADPARLVGRGDRAVEAGHHTLAYAAYSAAARAEEDYEALWKSARAAVDVGQSVGRDAAASWYERGEALARRAVDARPEAPEGHLQLAQALGLVALDAGVRERVQMSEEIRAEARATIEADSSYAGGWHVLGRWNRGVMELSGFGRMFARTFLGGEVLDEASWEKAERYLERAAELEPRRLVHHLELGKVYRQREKPDRARESLRTALRLPPWDYRDCVYQAEARRLLEEMGDAG